MKKKTDRNYGILISVKPCNALLSVLQNFFANYFPPPNTSSTNLIQILIPTFNDLHTKYGNGVAF